jgi:glucokinase
MLSGLILAIDIGGTNTSLGFVNNEGKILNKKKMMTGDSSDPLELVGRIAEIVKGSSKLFEGNYKLTGIGVGAPNANYFKGTIENPVNLNWKGIIPFKEILEQQFNIPVAITNDANAGALGEMYFGGAQNMKDFVFITLGTGLGAGIVANGKLVYGHNSLAGELGHTTIVKNGRLCGCNRRGCLEQYCSATGLVKTYLKLKGNKTKAKKHEVDARVIYNRAINGDKIAKDSIDYTGNLLGLALANTVAHLDPEAIFLFGGLMGAYKLFKNRLQESFENNVYFQFKNKVKILKSQLQENNASLLGAASIARQIL